MPVYAEAGNAGCRLCVYTGDVPYQHWGQWKDRAGEKSTVKIPRGYSYDILNNDVLINGAEFENGKLVLPGGMAYKALIVDLDSQLVSPEALEKYSSSRMPDYPSYAAELRQPVLPDWARIPNL